MTGNGSSTHSYSAVYSTCIDKNKTKEIIIKNEKGSETRINNKSNFKSQKWTNVKQMKQLKIFELSSVNLYI